MHVGIEAKVAALRTAGATVTQPVETIQGLWKHALVVDPWGVKIELVESGERGGFHHITLRVANPEDSSAWYRHSFGGERTKIGGRLDAVKYGNTYLIVTKGQSAAPSRGHAIDHLGFGPRSIDMTAADLKGKGVTFTAEPAAKPNQFTIIATSPAAKRSPLLTESISSCPGGVASRSLTSRR